MIKFGIIAALLLASPIAAQQVQSPVNTVYVDTGNNACMSVRLMDYNRSKAEYKAKKIVRDARKNGQEVNVVLTEDNFVVGTFNTNRGYIGGAPVYRHIC